MIRCEFVRADSSLTPGWVWAEHPGKIIVGRYQGRHVATLTPVPGWPDFYTWVVAVGHRARCGNGVGHYPDVARRARVMVLELLAADFPSRTDAQ